MGLFKKKTEAVKEPQYYTSATNMRTYNYRVYYMSALEKALYALLAFAVGAAVGYLFYGGIGKDEFGRPTTVTIVLNILIPCIVGIIAVVLFLPAQTKSISRKKQLQLSHQFRDMLDALTTSLGAGKNVSDAFQAAYEDLKVQYENGAFILSELEVILSGIQNNIPVEALLEDFGKRSGNDDIRSFAGVFSVAYRKGGNIRDIIRSTHSILSEKMEIMDDIETMTTANRVEQNIMVFMPIVLIAVIKMMSPDFAHNFVTPTGIISTTISIAIFVAAYFFGRAVLTIKV